MIFSKLIKIALRMIMAAAFNINCSILVSAYIHYTHLSDTFPTKLSSKQNIVMGIFKNTLKDVKFSFAETSSNTTLFVYM